MGFQISKAVIPAAGLGTRFLPCPESRYTEANKKAVLEAAPNSTSRSMAFDEMRGTMGWPAGIDGRALKNGILEDERLGLSLEERLKLFKTSADQGKADRLVVWAGTGVGDVNSVMPAAVRIFLLLKELILTLSP